MYHLFLVLFDPSPPTFQIQRRLQASDENSSDDEEMGRPGGPRFSTDYDESPRNCLDLLALNRLGLRVMWLDHDLIFVSFGQLLQLKCDVDVGIEARNQVIFYDFPAVTDTGLQILSSWSLPSKR